MIKLKQLAAATALACAAPAFAGIADWNDDAELFGIVWDEAFATYVVDFGITWGQLRGASGSFTLATTGGANWASYVAADTNLNDFSKFEGTHWGVYAVDIDGFHILDETGFISTTSGGVLPTLNNEFQRTMTDRLSFLTGKYNQNGLTPNLALNGDLFAALGQPAHLLETDLGVNFQFFTGNAVNSGPVALSTCRGGNFAGGFDDYAPADCGYFMTDAGRGVSVNFDGNTFSAVVAVPEPGTYALFAAGLLAVGFVARRRA